MRSSIRAKTFHFQFSSVFGFARNTRFFSRNELNAAGCRCDGMESLFNSLQEKISNLLFFNWERSIRSFSSGGNGSRTFHFPTFHYGQYSAEIVQGGGVLRFWFRNLENFSKTYAVVCATSSFRESLIAFAIGLIDLLPIIREVITTVT